jgi:hypothetical protein
MFPEFIRRPLKGMSTGLGRFVLRVVKLAGISVIATFVFLVLDAVLLRGVERKTEREATATVAVWRRIRHCIGSRQVLTLSTTGRS